MLRDTGRRDIHLVEATRGRAVVGYAIVGVAKEHGTGADLEDVVVADRTSNGDLDVRLIRDALAWMREIDMSVITMTSHDETTVRALLMLGFVRRPATRQTFDRHL